MEEVKKKVWAKVNMDQPETDQSESGQESSKSMSMSPKPLKYLQQSLYRKRG